VARRIYEKDGAVVEIQYMADSPMAAQMGLMFTNPQIAAASGGKLLRFGRQKAVMTGDGEIGCLVDNRILVQISGNASEDDKIAYGEAIDMRALKNF